VKNGEENHGRGMLNDRDRFRRGRRWNAGSFSTGWHG